MWGSTSLETHPFCQEDDKTYLLYSVAGESGIAIAEINFDSP